MFQFIFSKNILLTYLLVSLAFPARASDQKSQVDRAQAFSIETQAHLVDLVPELSGLAVSTHVINSEKRQRLKDQDHRLIWGHNDSGHQAEIFGFEANGQIRVILELPVKALDIEDIAAKTCPWSLTKQCLWLADVGDNKHQRQSVSLHVLPLPNFESLVSEHILRLKIDRLQISSYRFTYPNRKRPNVEALAVSPNGEQVWLFEKTDADQVHFWSLTIPSSSLGTIQNIHRIQEYSLDVSHWASRSQSSRQRRITGASLDQSGQRLLLRTYQDVWLYESSKTKKITAKVIQQQKPKHINFTAHELQGEAICFDLDHQGFWTGSEQKNDQPAKLHHTQF